MDRVTWRGDERVLDAGCGSGRLTALLAARARRGRVVALDQSRNMALEARDNLTAVAPASTAVVVADLCALPFAATFDVIFSTAVFHWIADHETLFRQLHGALAPGGLLVAQCGGGPNIAQLHSRAMTLARTPRYATYFEHWRDPWNYATPADTRTRLAAAGFADIETDLEEAPTVLPDAPTYAAFLTTVILRTHLTYLPDETLRRQFIGELTSAAACDGRGYFIDYWRLNLMARRPA